MSPFLEIAAFENNFAPRCDTSVFTVWPWGTVMCCIRSKWNTHFCSQLIVYYSSGGLRYLVSRFLLLLANRYFFQAAVLHNPWWQHAWYMKTTTRLSMQTWSTVGRISHNFCFFNLEYSHAPAPSLPPLPSRPHAYQYCPRSPPPTYVCACFWSYHVGAVSMIFLVFVSTSAMLVMSGTMACRCWLESDPEKQALMMVLAGTPSVSKSISKREQIIQRHY